MEKEIEMKLLKEEETEKDSNSPAVNLEMEQEVERALTEEDDAGTGGEAVMPPPRIILKASTPFPGRAYPSASSPCSSTSSLSSMKTVQSNDAHSTEGESGEARKKTVRRGGKKEKARKERIRQRQSQSSTPMGSSDTGAAASSGQLSTPKRKASDRSPFQSGISPEFKALKGIIQRAKLAYDATDGIGAGTAGDYGSVGASGNTGATGDASAFKNVSANESVGTSGNATGETTGAVATSGDAATVAVAGGSGAQVAGPSHRNPIGNASLGSARGSGSANVHARGDANSAGTFSASRNTSHPQASTRGKHFPSTNRGQSRQNRGAATRGRGKSARGNSARPRPQGLNPVYRDALVRTSVWATYDVLAHREVLEEDAAALKAALEVAIAEEEDADKVQITQANLNEEKRFVVSCVNPKTVAWVLDTIPTLLSGKFKAWDFDHFPDDLRKGEFYSWIEGPAVPFHDILPRIIRQNPTIGAESWALRDVRWSPWQGREGQWITLGIPHSCLKALEETKYQFRFLSRITLPLAVSLPQDERKKVHARDRFAGQPATAP